MKILILGKLGLKLVFLKNITSHTHAFHSYFSMLGRVNAQNWVVFQNCVFFIISIDRGCISIDRNCFKNFKGASVCFNQPKLIFNQSKIVNKVFKNLILTCSTHFFQNFSSFSFSLRLCKGFSSNFCHFPSIFLQGFPLSRPIRTLYPSFWIYFHVFMYKFMHFVGIFEPIQIWGFWRFKPSFLKLIIGFCSYNIINIIYGV